MRKAVLISLDALYEEDLSLLSEGFIGQLMAKGRLCTQVKTVFPALTYPAHVTLVTGEKPAVHGIGHNQPFQPEVPTGYRKWYWEAKDVQVPTLFDKVKAAGGTCASILWPVTGKNPAIRYNFPEVLALPGESQVWKMLTYGSPAWVLSTELRLGKQRVSAKEPYLSDYGALLACDVIRRKQPDLTALHMVDLDDTRHHFGTHSPEAIEALRRLDRRVEQIYRTVQTTKGMEDALFALVSDHGQSDISRSVMLSKEFEKLGIPNAQVQSNGMSAYLMNHPMGLEDCLAAHREALGISRVYSRKDLDDMGAIAAPALAVEASPGVVFTDALEEEKREKATHGFGPGHPAENCLFLMVGDGVGAEKLPSMGMEGVAGILSTAMGLV